MQTVSLEHLVPDVLGESLVFYTTPNSHGKQSKKPVSGAEQEQNKSVVLRIHTFKYIQSEWGWSRPVDVYCRRSKLHYGECSEQTAGWSGGELQAVGQERQLFRWRWRQASTFYAAGPGPACLSADVSWRTW